MPLRECRGLGNGSQWGICFVQNYPTVFDINFAVEFNKVRPIVEGSWSANLSNIFEDFRIYLSKFPQFEKHLEEKRKEEAEAKKIQIIALRSELKENMLLLNAWGTKNILDEKTAEIVMLSSSASEG